MKTKLKWRLSKLPTPDELRELVKDKIVTQEEARDILFTQETEEEREETDLKTEIKFLRELVEKLSKNRTEIVKTIGYIQPYYHSYDWYRPYQTWCSASYTSITIDGNATDYTGGVTNAVLTSASSTSANFSDINTF